MQYREFGNLDWKVSALGFGAMRLPTDEEGNIKENRAIKMIRYAVDKGVNYIDTAWPYHGGQSEPLVGKALENGYRDQVKVATKLPSWEVETEADLDKYLNKQLEKLKLDKIDFYLLHALTEEHWNNYKQLGLEKVFAWIEQAKAAGKIDYIGFSFHDDYELFTEIVDSYEWDFCQLQYNYLDTEFQAGKKGLKYAAKQDIPVVVMEPLRGGSLAGPLPQPIKDIFAQTEVERTAVDWALQWLWNQSEVAVVLSGMSNLQQVKENIISASNSEVNSLTEVELKAVNQAAARYKEVSPVACTGCGYCLPCPVGVKIPTIFSLYNEASVFSLAEESKQEYRQLSDEEQAGACIGCGQCEGSCPQDLAIIEQLEAVADYFTE